MRLEIEICKQEISGSITVFLSLILLLILSLILTITEGARVSSAKVYAERTLSTAMDSVLADYYGPLWEEYHIFGLYTGEESDSKQKEQIASKLSNYMSYTFQPDKDLDIKKDNNWELHNIKLDKVSVDNTTALMNYQGELLINEAVEYMKYQDVGNGIELLLDKLSLLETPKKVSYVYDEMQKAEEKLIEIDKGVLQLMELLDGLKTSENGIETSKNGDLKTAQYYVKKICFGEITKESVGLNNENVFEALKDCYVNPENELSTLENNFANLEQVMNRIYDIQRQKEEALSQRSTEQVKLDEINAIVKKTKKNKAQIKEIKKTISSLNKQIDNYEEEAKEQGDSKVSWVKAISTSKDNLLQLVSKTGLIIKQAISKVDSIIQQTQIAGPFIDEYEKILYSNQNQLGKEAYTGLEESLKNMKKYTSVDAKEYDFLGMKEILEKDLAIITQVEGLINKAESELTQDHTDNARIFLVMARTEIKNYQTKGLTLDYSTLVLNQSSQKNPLNSINDILQAGIISMVIDPDKISDKKLTLKTLPSQVAILAEGNTDFSSKLIEFFRNAASGGCLGMGNLFNSFGEGTDILSMAGKGANKIAEHLLYQEYLKEHFETYSPKEKPKTSKPSALNYEQEYLLAGHLADKENFNSVISRILFARTTLDFVSLIGDSAKRNEAYAAAAAIVGFTGLPILITITQGLILLAWSFAEALLDVCALLKEKEVPILKKKVLLELPELFMINRKFLENKAVAFKDSKELSLTYQDYIRLFLVLKEKKDLAFRSMDLIQEDIRIRYNESSFDITRCMYGYEADLDYTVPSKFTRITFVQKYLNTRRDGFSFTAKAAYSY